MLAGHRCGLGYEEPCSDDALCGIARSGDDKFTKGTVRQLGCTPKQAPLLDRETDFEMLHQRLHRRTGTRIPNAAIAHSTINPAQASNTAARPKCVAIHPPSDPPADTPSDCTVL